MNIFRRQGRLKYFILTGHGLKFYTCKQTINKKIHYYYLFFIYYYYFISTLQCNKKVVCLRPQIAKANPGGRSYRQSVVKPVIIKLQQYNNIKLNTTLLNERNKKTR